MKNVFITGASRGIGLALSTLFLEKGYRVYGIGRTPPAALLRHPHFNFQAVDLSQSEAASNALLQYFRNEADLRRIEYLFLNAGQFSARIADMRDVPLAELEALMSINVWANKVVLDALLNSGVAVDSCILSSSLAGVRARAGNSGYAISKAALNMLAKLYALEAPDIFFAVLGLCNVDSELSRRIGALPLEGDFSAIEDLRKRAVQKDYLVTPGQRALDIYELLEGGLRERVASGDFVEIRSLLNGAVRPQSSSSTVYCAEHRQ